MYQQLEHPCYNLRICPLSLPPSLSLFLPSTHTYIHTRASPCLSRSLCSHICSYTQSLTPNAERKREGERERGYKFSIRMSERTYQKLTVNAYTSFNVKSAIALWSSSQ